MNTLRAKIAILLVVAIVSVVGIITWVMLAMLGPPAPERTTEPLADQIEMFLRVAKQDTSGLTLVPEPSPGELRENATARLRAELAKRGHDLPVSITRKDWNAPLVVSIPIDTKGWLLMPIPDLPPQRKPWFGLLKWLALITVGVTAIAVFAAHRMVQPLVLLENAVESVGPDTILPHLPERGPAEVRATARALNSLSSRLRRAIESRMRLLAAAGHDLRTPITRMRLRAEFVDDDEERSLWLSDLDELERIADSAILLVREESGKAAPETVWLDRLVADVAREHKSAVKLTFAKGASLKDPSGLFNASLEGNTRRAIDFHEGDKINAKALKALIRAAVALNISVRAAARPVRSQKKPKSA